MPDFRKADDICARPEPAEPHVTQPLSPPIVPTTVWRCDTTSQADALLGGELAGYVYQRDGHPNADQLAAKCRALHQAAQAAITGSGMTALSLAVLSQLQCGDHVVVSNQLYGRSLQLLTDETRRLGIEHTLVDPCDLSAVAEALRPETQLVVVETMANPGLRVADLRSLAELAHRPGATLLVDNTFATPALCQPLTLGADLVLESVSKMMNGHSDVMLGLLCGKESVWQRVPDTLSAWGLGSSPFDCWLALRGLATLHVRVERACRNAEHVARLLAEHAAVERVDYPGLEEHPDHELAQRQLPGGFGWMVTFHLRGGQAAADRLIQATRESIPFCPSLGETVTTLSHPASTSHRRLSADQRAALGIGEGTIRLSVGLESPEFLLGQLQEALARL